MKDKIASSAEKPECLDQLASQIFKVEAKFDLPTDLNIRAFRQNWQFYPSFLTAEVHNRFKV